MYPCLILFAISQIFRIFAIHFKRGWRNGRRASFRS
nr:MAG TPA: Pro-corazonin [Bacteriophage sp.]